MARSGIVFRFLSAAFLRREKPAPVPAPPTGAARAAALKVATYNIHSCIDTSRVFDMEKVAAVVSDLDPDVLALQEVDAFRPRTANAFQAKWLAERLGMGYFYYPVVKNGVEKYGIAILSKVPMEKVKFGRLPTVLLKRKLEIRGAMWVRVEAGGTRVNLINTHLGLFARERRLQIRALLGREWLGCVNDGEPVVFCGDFNAGRRSYVYRQVIDRLRDAQVAKEEKGPLKKTYFSFYPVLCLDHIFVSQHFSVVRTRIPGDLLARTASDHLPVAAELALREAD